MYIAKWIIIIYADIDINTKVRNILDFIQKLKEISLKKNISPNVLKKLVEIDKIIRLK